MQQVQKESHVTTEPVVTEKPPVTAATTPVHNQTEEMVHPAAREILTTTPPLFEATGRTENVIPRQFTAQTSIAHVTVHEIAQQSDDASRETAARQYIQTTENHTERVPEIAKVETEIATHDSEYADELISEKSKMLLIAAVEQQFTEIIQNPENWSHDSQPNSDEMSDQNLIPNTEVEEFKNTEFKTILNELFNEETSAEENPLFITDESIGAVEEEAARFSKHLELFLQESPEQASDEVTETLHATLLKIQSIVENTEQAQNITFGSIEIPAQDIESLLTACSEIIGFLGYEATEQNARKLLTKLIISVQVVNELEEHHSTKLWLNTMGTYEYKFNNVFSHLPSSIDTQGIVHQVLGQYVLTQAQVA